MAQETQDSPETGFALGKKNLQLLLIGFVIIVFGFILMVGGKSEDPSVFNPDMFNFRRVTLAPLVVLFGFLFEIYAIMKKTKDGEQPEKND